MKPPTYMLHVWYTHLHVAYFLGTWSIWVIITIRICIHHMCIYHTIIYTHTFNIWISEWCNCVIGLVWTSSIYLRFEIGRRKAHLDEHSPYWFDRFRSLVSVPKGSPSHAIPSWWCCALLFGLGILIDHWSYAPITIDEPSGIPTSL